MKKVSNNLVIIANYFWRHTSSETLIASIELESDS